MSESKIYMGDQLIGTVTGWSISDKPYPDDVYTLPVRDDDSNGKPLIVEDLDLSQIKLVGTFTNEPIKFKIKDISPRPWRRGGACEFINDDFKELTLGTAIWDADNQPVIELKDWYSDDDIDAIVEAVNKVYS